MQAYGTDRMMAGLPDPERDRQFYEGVPSRRLAAWVFDAIVILAIGVPLGVFFGLVTFGLGFAAFPFLIGCVSFAYRIATISSSSATWGMRLMGIELRRFDGSRFDLSTAVMHTAIYLFAFAFFLIQIISCAFMINTRYGQGLPDLVLRTTAINRPAD